MSNGPEAKAPGLIFAPWLISWYNSSKPRPPFSSRPSDFMEAL